MIAKNIDIMFRNKETSVNTSNTQRRKQSNERTNKNPRLSGRQRYLVSPDQVGKSVDLYLKLTQF